MRSGPRSEIPLRDRMDRALRRAACSIALAILLGAATAHAEQAFDCEAGDPAAIELASGPEQNPSLAGAPGSFEFASRLNDAGAAALDRGDLVRAEAYHRRALAIRLRLAPDSLPVAQTLDALGRVALVRGDLVRAKEYLERSFRIRQSSATSSRDVALSLVSLGKLARRRGDLAGERAYFEQALQVGDVLTPQDLADILEGLGSVCGQLDCTRKPQEYLRRALQLRRQWQPDSLGLASTLSFLGKSEIAQGELEEAERDFIEALALRRRLAPGSLVFAASLVDVGTLARARGHLATAELCLRQALRIRQRLASHSLAVADALHNLGIVLWLRDDLDGAQDYFETALRLRRKLLPGSPVLAQSLIWQGLLCVRRKRLADAQTYLGDALDLLEKTVSPEGLAVGSVLSDLGSLATTRGELVLAQRYYRQALAIQIREAPDSPAEALILQALGGLLRRQGDLAEAENDYRRALAIQEQKVPDASAHAGTLFALASLQRQEQKREDAERTYARALDVLERLDAGIGGTAEDRSVFRARFEDNYKDYSNLLIALGRPESALCVMERARARTLLETLGEAKVSVRSGRDDELDRLKHTLQEEIGAKSSYRIRLLDGSHTQAQLSELDRRLSTLSRHYRETEDRLQLQNPAYAALIRPQTLTGQQVQQLLDEDTVLLEYSLGPGVSHVWAVTRATLAVYALPPRRRIERSVARVRDLMTARAGQATETQAQRHRRLAWADAQYPAAARELSQLVLGPVAGLMGNRRIVIVSDGALRYVPFAALPMPSGQPSSAAHERLRDSGDELLVMQHEITNLPSASVLAELRRQAVQRMPPPKAVVVLADPVFDPRDERIRQQEGDAATDAQNSAVQPVEGAMSASLRGIASGPVGARAESGYLDRLLWTRLEAAQILKVTPPGQGMQALDFEASRATALSPLLSQYRIVHFATHAILDSAHLERSGLVLSLFDAQGRPQNGFLGLEQIYGLNLPADLVVLSACDTSLGKDVGAEGLIGLVRGFMYAGATRVMASLWSVDDEGTAQLMALFYKNLEAGGLSPVAALRAAQLELRRQARWRAPYYWAGFQIEGEWR